MRTVGDGRDGDVVGAAPPAEAAAASGFGVSAGSAPMDGDSGDVLSHGAGDEFGEQDLGMDTMVDIGDFMAVTNRHLSHERTLEDGVPGEEVREMQGLDYGAPTTASFEEARRVAEDYNPLGPAGGHGRGAGSAGPYVGVGVGVEVGASLPGPFASVAMEDGG